MRRRMHGLGRTVTRTLPALVLAAVVGCGTTDLTGQPDASEDSTIMDPDVEDLSAEDTAEPDADPPEIPADPVEDLIPDGPTGILVPEGPEEVYGTDSDHAISLIGWKMPVAYSGSVYGIVAETGMHLDHPLGVYVLAPGSEYLATSWIDSAWVEYRNASICWTGEVFLVALHEEGIGVRILSVNEDGSLARPPEVLDSRPTDSMGFVNALCTSEGPFVISPGLDTSGIRRLHHINVDGSPEGTYIDSELFVPSRCKSVGAEAACTSWSGISFVRRDGTQRDSEPLPDCPPEDLCMLCGRDLAFTGDGVAFLFSRGEECTLVYALYDLEGNFIVPPVTSYSVAEEIYMPDTIRTASSGDTVFVVGNALVPHVFLFDLDSAPLDAYVPLSSSEEMAEPRWEAFWEGDAYSVIWMQHGMIAYRRFLVE